MDLVIARRTAIVAALFAVAGCSGSPSSSNSVPSNPANLGTLSRVQSLQSGGLPFVHAGVPFAARTSHAVRPAVRPDYPTRKPLLFEGDQGAGAVHVYGLKRLAHNPAPIATIPNAGGCPYGMALDKKGTLYVAGNCGGSTVTEYAKGKSTPSLVVSNGISNPLGVAIDSSQNMWVTNYPAAITEYAQGATSPSQTITGGGLTDPFGIAVDKNDNLFICDFGALQVFEVVKGSTTPQALNLQNLDEPIGVAFDGAGNMWVTDGSGNRVNVYPPGSTTPSRTITTGFSFPYAISVNAAGAAFISNLNGTPDSVFAFKPGANSPYANLTHSINLPTGLLVGKP